MANAAALKTADSPTSLARGDADPDSPFAFAMLTHRGRVRHSNQDTCAAAPDHAGFVVCDGVGGAAGGEVASQLATETFLNALRSSANTGRVPYSYATERARTGGNEQSPVSHSLRGVSRNMGGKEESGLSSKLRLGGHENSSPSPHTRLHHAILAANAAVYQRAQRNRSLRGMATTLVAALLEYPDAISNDGVPHSYAGVSSRMNGMNTDPTANNEPFACPTLWLAHAGDSRAYLFRSGELTQLTNDHSLVEEQVRAGILHPSQAAHSPIRNVITRAIGSMPTVEPEIACHPILPGDLYLLASDGLTRELTDDEIAHILTAALSLDSEDAAAFRVPHSPRDDSRAMVGMNSSVTLQAAAQALSTQPQTFRPSLEAAAQALIDAANRHGGRDNITVLLLACR